MPRHKLAIALLLSLASSLLPAAVYAQQNPPSATGLTVQEIERLQARYDALDKRVKEIEKRLSSLQLAEEQSQTAALAKRVAALESNALESKKKGSQVQAPFTVVDDKGVPIMQVTAGSIRGLYVLDAAGTTVQGVAIEGGDKPGIRVMNSSRQGWFGEMHDGTLGAYIAGDSGENDIKTLMSEDKGFEVRKNNQRIANLGITEKGNVALRLYSNASGPKNPLAAVGVSNSDNEGGVEIRDASGKLLAKVGSDANRNGNVSVFRDSDRPIASLRAENDGGGLVAVWNDQGNAIASLSKGANGGVLELTSLGGEPMVQGGVTGAQIGVVRAGPASTPGGIMGMGVPGSFIMGKREGGGSGE